MSTNGAFHEDPAAIALPALIPPPELHALAIQRAPELVLQEAKKAAKALNDLIESKPNKCVIEGKTYLQFEDWQTLGRFYGVTVAARSTKYIEYGETRGFEATAEALLVGSNQVISSAEAMCLDDEWKWTDKPMFQLKSMAQTRACAKAFRNVLAWVVVLAGYQPTPAEEIEADAPAVPAPRRRSETAPASTIEPPRRRDSNSISDAQINRLYAIAREKGISKPELHAWLAKCGYPEVKLISKDRYQDLSNALLGVN
jgi:hypothetical protein